MYFTIQRAMCDILPDLVVHLFTFICKYGFIKLLCTHDFSRVSFAADLSTTLVYNSVFVKDYDFIYMFFFFFFFYIYKY